MCFVKEKKNVFLHFTSSAWRQNFLRIKKLVLIGGPDDDVITPWQSRFDCHHSFIFMCLSDKCIAYKHRDRKGNYSDSFFFTEKTNL